MALALRAAMADFALPVDALEAMLDARLQAMAPERSFDLAAFEAYAANSEGARLRLASQIAAGAPISMRRARMRRRASRWR